MKNKVSILISRAVALVLCTAPVIPASAQEVYSATIGAVKMTVPSESDVLVALPFKQEKLAGGLVDSVSGSSVNVSTTLSAGAFDATGSGADAVYSHYLYVEEGPLMGRHFDIVSNTASTIVLNASGLADLVGNVFTIRSNWTLGTLFPEGVGYTEEPEAGLRQVEVILPETASAGGGLAANRVFYYYDGSWREVGEPLSSNADDSVLLPGFAFVVRNNGSTSLDYFFFGEVEYGPLAIPLVSSTETVDNFVAVGRPLGLTINELGLQDSGVFGPGDKLLVYDANAGKNPTPTTYIYESSLWQVEGGDGTDAGSTLISAGQAVAVRKAAGTDGTDYWVNEWSLSQ